MEELASAPLPYMTGQSVNKQLTTNCNALTEATFDINDSTWVTFYFENSVPLWLVLLSIATQQVTLGQSITACGIILTKGLQVTLNPMGGTYTVLLSGEIIDNGTTYQCSGTLLGSFSRGAAMKQAVKSIREGRIQYGPCYASKNVKRSGLIQFDT
ncbi:hypothetical protein ABIC65_000170 [Sphingomonas trueperi]|uniref:hypothetical protein n=1 Tax=Sphingomonas trueperi TaxID=53317 RepID=UPI003395CD77